MFHPSMVLGPNPLFFIGGCFVHGGVGVHMVGGHGIVGTSWLVGFLVKSWQGVVVHPNHPPHLGALGGFFSRPS